MRYGHERYTAPEGWTRGGVEGWVEKDGAERIRGLGGIETRMEIGGRRERERERADIGHERASERAEWERLRWGEGVR